MITVEAERDGSDLSFRILKRKIFIAKQIFFINKFFTDRKLKFEKKINHDTK
jgi:hypothetical protein